MERPDVSPKSMVATRPRFSTAQASELAATRFGVSGTATELVGERDQNFRIDAADGRRVTLKISNPGESTEFIDLQRAVLRRLAERKVAGVPREIAPIDDAPNVVVEGPGGPCAARVLTWIAGRPLADCRPQTPDLLRGVGALLARVDEALLDLDHPAAERSFPWNPDDGVATVRERIDDVPDSERRDLLRRVVARFERDVAPRLDDVRRALIQNDANDRNVMVATPRATPSQVTGLIDFGDAVRTWLVCEPAIAAAYAMFGKRDPLAAMAQVIEGFHAVLPLTDDELAVAFDFVRLRLATSVSMSARGRREAPDHAYLGVSERAAWDTLSRTDAYHPRFVEYLLRDACGLPPCPRSVAVSSWIERHAAAAAPVLAIADDCFATCEIDLSVATGDIDTDDLERATREVFRRMEDAGATVGVGRYDEVRACYIGDAFAEEGDDRALRRTVHLGVDLFVPAETAVMAPLAGEVLSVKDNPGQLDYGPTVMLRHTPVDGPEFFTLYGHLDRDCLTTLTPGQPIARGQAFANVGPVWHNGGWPPHLHFQVIADRLDRAGDFPGVAAPHRRALWTSICPDPTPLLRGVDEGRAAPTPGDAALLAARRERVPSSLSVSYARPLTIVRGRGAYLYDADGQPYLDCVNNVCHVGHAHPRVVAAAARQMAILNTNTRYLHPQLVEYARRLTGLFPEPLSVCFLVCTGSEANELALRLAYAATGRRDVIALQSGYHGNTSGLIDVSSYKHDGEGGRGAPGHVHTVPLPDRFRGQHRDGDGDLGALYAAHVEEVTRRLVAEGRPPAAFLAESIASCGGQVVYPGGYLSRCYSAIRAAGGVTIADEVQVGFGRVGENWWAFQTQGVVPDIVTLGKPIGNGHPLAAVITTRAIADAFDGGMEYFNTFGGNPVSCAVGLAVLDVIEEEGLLANATEVGQALRRGLQGLMDRHSSIGDVRGLGLFLGVELVKDRGSRAPDPDAARYVCNRMRDRGVLLSADGPDVNVLKIKPPMVFSLDDADRLVAILDEVLSEDSLRPSNAPERRA